jgi:hypothetical protein
MVKFCGQELCDQEPEVARPIKSPANELSSCSRARELIIAEWRNRPSVAHLTGCQIAVEAK